MNRTIGMMTLMLCGALHAADWNVYLRKVGPLRIGMTLPEARRAVGDLKAALESPGDAPEECGYLKTTKLPEGLALMFVRGKLARIDVHGNLRTASGAGVGDTEERIKELYPGKIRVDRHKYLEDGHYLRFIPADAADSGYELLFETDRGKVTSFRAGFREQVSWVEGCL